MKKQIMTLLGLCSITPAVLAHSGEHHGFMMTLWHVVSQPDHLLGIVVGSVVTLGLIALMFKLKRSAKIEAARQQ